jgi:chromosome segregation ATPase
MNVEEIPRQLQELFDRSRAVLDAQITKARKVVNDLNAEKTGAAKALADLKDQITKAKVDLDAVVADLDRASNARRSDHELAKACAESERLTAENAKVATALEARLKQCAEADTKLVTLQNDARLATAERCRAQEMVAQIRSRLEQWS